MNKLFLIKSFFLFCCISVFLQCSHAGTMGALIPTSQNGFYVGGDIGVADLMNKESHTVNPETHQLGSVGIIGGGFVGYDYNLTPQFGAALELFADATGLNTSIQHSALTYSMNQRYDVGIRVLPKYAFTLHTVGHVILGYINGKFNIHDEGVYGFVDSGFNKSGFQSGIGFTQHLNNNLALRLDALYNLYASQTTVGTGLANGTTQTYRNAFHVFAGELGLIYAFS